MQTPTQQKHYTGTLYIVSAPSGAGKSSLIKAYINSESGFDACVSVSHTTRMPRPGENNAEHYYFVDVATFEAMIKQDYFVEQACVFDNYYGTSKQEIENNLLNGIDVFLDIDWQGARQVREKMPTARSIFILPPSLAELERRLRTRGQDSEEVIQKRMQQAESEISHYNEYDYQIINDNFNDTLADFMSIMRAERLRTSIQNVKNAELIQALLR